MPFPVKSKEDFSQGREQKVISLEVWRVAIELQEKKPRSGEPKIKHGRADVRYRLSATPYHQHETNLLCVKRDALSPDSG